MSEKKTIEDVMAEYAAKEEKNSGAIPSQKTSPANRVQDTFAEEAKEQANTRMSLAEAQAARREEIKAEQRSLGVGYVEIPIEDLPSGGIFYPQGTRINIRAASGGDIRHWSMMNETELSQIDDALNYIIERCVTISFPPGAGVATWKDLKEIDRFYLIIAVRDFTFTEGHNELKIAINENENVVVKKDNITFIDLNEKILSYYNPDKRCFTFKANTPSVGEINIYMPSVGVTQWLKSYIERKSRAQEAFDRDFITVAPMLIRDYRALTDKSYGELIFQTMSYGVYEWSLISKVKGILERAITPKMTYNDESGAEQETPLNFRGGIKALFTDNTLDEKLGL